MKNKKSIKSLLYSAVFMMSLLFLSISLWQIWASNKIFQNVLFLTRTQYPVMQNILLLDMQHDSIYGDVALLLSNNQNKDEMADAFLDHKEKITSIAHTLVDLIKSSSFSDVGGDSITDSVREYVDLANDVERATKNNVGDEIERVHVKFIAKFKAFAEEMEDLTKKINSVKHEKEKEIIDFVAVNRNLLLVLAFVCVFSIIALGFALNRIIIRKIMSVSSLLRDNSNQVKGTAEKLNKSSEDLSLSSSQQSSALQQTATAVNEISSMIKKTTSNSEQLNRSAEKSYQSAKSGQGAVMNMLKAINDISTSNQRITSQVLESNNKISEILRVIGEIENKTKIINDIVFQTKLLSFNASVEAARAGEHGKGFSVVAEEVGNLAQMSGNAAREISEMLAASIQKVNLIVDDSKRSVEALVQDGKSKLETGESVANQCHTELTSIVDQSEGVSKLIADMSSAIREQGLGIEEISRALSLLETSTRKNADTSHETSKTSEDLLSQFKSLVHAVHDLDILIGQKIDANDAENFEDETHHSVEKRDSKDHKEDHKYQNVSEKSLRFKKIEDKSHSQSFPSANDPRFEDI
jgi:methyl-accepting chemotaxis protein